MNKKNVIFLVLAVVVIGSGVYFASTPGVSGNGKLETSHLKYDFGQITMNNGKVEHPFILKNTSNEPITIKDVSTSCMCTQALLDYEGKEDGPFGMSGMSSGSSMANLTIDPGKEVVVKAVFDPAAHGPAGAGHIERNVYLKTNSQSQPEIVFDFTADVSL